MPVLNDAMTTLPISGSRYSFSATRIEDLGATEYTLGVVVLDVSGSTSGFRNEMEQALKSVVAACHRNPRADNMMLRVVKFDDKVTEIHGYKPLPDCNERDYDGCLGKGGGTTALYDACYTSIQSVTAYAEQLTANDFDVNAIAFVITDGCEYPPRNSTATRKMIKAALGASVAEEKVESMQSILIGVDAQTSDLRQYLQKLQKECGFTQYVGIEDATAASLAKLGDFISRSVSAQSLSLGTGGPSQSLVF